MNDPLTRALIDRALAGEATKSEESRLLGNMALCFQSQQDKFDQLDAKLDLLMSRLYRLVLILVSGVLIIAGVKATDLLTPPSAPAAASASR